MIRTDAEFLRHKAPFTHHTVDKMIEFTDLERLAAAAPAAELYRRLVKQGPWHVKNYRAWLLTLFEHGERTAAAEALPQPWTELLDDLLSPEFTTWASEGLDRDLTSLPVTVGVFRYGDGDHQTVHTAKAVKALHWVLHLNEEWRPGLGGELHLWESEDAVSPVLSIPPLGGTSVLFAPHAATWHSIGEVTAQGRFERTTVVLEYWQP
jgi:hypothetical protein